MSDPERGAPPFDSPSLPYVTAHRSVGRVPMHLFRLDQPPGDYSEAPMEVIMLTRADAPVHGRLDFGAGALPPLGPRGTFSVAAPDVAQDIVLDERSRLTALTLPVAPLAEALADHAPGFDGDFGPLHARHCRNPRVDRLIELLWREAAADSPYGALFAENAAQTIAVELLRDAHRVRTAAPPGANALPAALVARIDEHLEAHLGDDVSLADLAALVGLSPYHFSRAFKAATGLPPHRYLIERRVARARERLEHGGDPIVDVALECGFSSQAHMTSTFTRQLGVSPGRYRKERSR